MWYHTRYIIIMNWCSAKISWSLTPSLSLFTSIPCYPSCLAVVSNFYLIQKCKSSSNSLYNPFTDPSTVAVRIPLLLNACFSFFFCMLSDLRFFWALSHFLLLSVHPILSILLQTYMPDVSNLVLSLFTILKSLHSYMLMQS